MSGHPAAGILVTRGAPSPEELAVLTAVLLARAAATATATATFRAPGSTWHPDAFEAPHSWHRHN